MRKNWNQGTLWVLPLVALVVLAVLPVRFAGAQNLMTGAKAEIATMTIHGGSVSFSPKIAFEEMTLTVAGQGHRSTKSFRGGQTAAFAPVDSEGFQLPDGTYKWELVVSPRVRDLNPRAFSSGRISTDGRTAEAAKAPRGQRQSGSFTIQNGVMVDPNLVEPEPVRPLRAMSDPTLKPPPSAAERSAEQNDRDGS